MHDDITEFLNNDNNFTMVKKYWKSSNRTLSNALAGDF